MKKIFRIRVFHSQSDNRKSKIQNRKWAGLFAIVLALTMCGAVAMAQQAKKIPRIGFLAQTPPTEPQIEALSQGLRELGYVEGKNILIEYRHTEGKPDRLPGLAAELVRLKVDVIVVSGALATSAAQKTTREIPIVMAIAGDPVASGHVASLGRPGGNITGLTNLAPELGGKRLELLKEVVPGLSRVAIISDPTNPIFARQVSEVESSAQALKLQLHMLEVREPGDFDGAFAAAKKAQAGAVATLASAFLGAYRQKLVNLAEKSRLPTMYHNSGFVEVGGFMSYGVNNVDLYRRAATYVDKILKGAKPAEIPIEQPTKFELVINLKAAKQIGVTVPPNMLARADKVIK
ncbi:MAG TPA: ABC transporter substrate-binding protein [Candidatus Binatia bacterium]|jgi:putative ABC transport system substrate-binding protein